MQGDHPAHSDGAERKRYPRQQPALVLCEHHRSRKQVPGREAQTSQSSTQGRRAIGIRTKPKSQGCAYHRAYDRTEETAKNRGGQPKHQELPEPHGEPQALDDRQKLHGT